jgi:thiol-disulfide isomerase/thioredoxin
MSVLYFSATWCGPCKTFKPVLQQTSTELGIPVNYIDVDANGAMAQKYNVNSVPTLLITDATGNVVKRQVGASISKHALTQFLSSAK